MHDLSKRLVTAAILIIVYLAVLYLGSSTIPYVNFIAVLFFALLGMIISLEFAGLAKLALRSDFFRWPAFVICILPVLSAIYAIVFHGLFTPLSTVLFILLGLIVSCTAVFVLAVYRGRYEIAVAVEVVRYFLPAVFLIGLGSASLCALINMRECFNVLLWLTLTVAINDTAAYFIGSKFGETPLAPSISPKKSIEGTVAGLFFGTLTGVLSFPLIADLPWYCTIFFCLGIVIAAQVGDLIKSYLKRLAGTKDSANWLPGHGGLLDRADALLATAPILLVFLAVYSGL